MAFLLLLLLLTPPNAAAAANGSRPRTSTNLYSAPPGWRIISSVALLEDLDSLERHLLRLLEPGPVPAACWAAGPGPALRGLLVSVWRERRDSEEPYAHHPLSQFRLVRRFAEWWPRWLGSAGSGESVESGWCRRCREARSIYDAEWHVGLARVSSEEEFNSGRLLSGMAARHGLNPDDWATGRVLSVATAPLTDDEAMELAAIAACDERTRQSDRPAHVAFWLAVVQRRRGTCDSLLGDSGLPRPALGFGRDGASGLLDLLARRCAGGLPQLQRALDAACADLDFLLLYHRRLEALGGRAELNRACAAPGALYQTGRLPRALVCFMKAHPPGAYYRFRVEELAIAPLSVLLIVDFISARCSARLVKKYEGQMVPALVVSPKGKLRYGQDSRNAYQARSQPKEAAKVIDHGLERLEGFRAYYPESIYKKQIVAVNYGVVGQYRVHHDAYPNAYPYINNNTGNRLASLVIYLTNVTVGGGTYFPKLGAKAAAVAGSAIMWYNFVNGTFQPATLHTGCPVDVGNKWILNKWVLEGGQEHLRVCPK